MILTCYYKSSNSSLDKKAKDQWLTVEMCCFGTKYESSYTTVLYVAYIYKWNKHFYEMKEDVGMSLHEKERNKMPTPRHKVTHNPIPTSLFCFNLLFVCLFVMNALGKSNSTTS